MNGASRGSGWGTLWSLILVLVLVMVPMTEATAKRNNRDPRLSAGNGWELKFRDEFNGTALDERKWTTAFPWGRDRSSVGELQYYAPDAFSLGNGVLRILATPSPGGTHSYDSGLISSHASFAQQYGRYEIRSRLPRGTGLWPAFWLLPPDTSWPPEIDVFEALGQEPDSVNMTVHWSKAGEHRQNGARYTGPNFSRGFHTFAVEWGPDTLVWFVDGVERHRVRGHSPQGPMYVLANLAVGGSWPGAPDASTSFPASFDIDYIRVYAAKTAPAAEDGKTSPGRKDGDGDGEGGRRQRNGRAR